MKKLLCVILSVMFVISLTACSKENTSSDKATVDIEYYANLGQIPECSYALGEEISKIKSELQAAGEEAEEHAGLQHTHYVFEEIEGDESVLLDNGTYKYYYLKEKEADGLSYIVSYDDTVYGIKLGTLITEVKETISSDDYVEEEISADNAFFYFGAGGTVLKYQFKDNTVMFVFEDNALIAAAIYTTEDWK